MRDLDKNPYSGAEQRVARFFFDRGTGGGDDPIGAILASHQALADERNAARAPITMQDIRLAAGEGTLSAHDVLAAANAVIRSRSREGSSAAYRIEYDGFEGTVIGSYITKEGKTGVVLQQTGTRVVHVYGTKHLVEVKT